MSGRNRLAYDERVALDVDYAQHLSFGRDLAILARTLPAMIRGGGSSSSPLEPATELLVPTGTTGG